MGVWGGREVGKPVEKAEDGVGSNFVFLSRQQSLF